MLHHWIVSSILNKTRFNKWQLKKKKRQHQQNGKLFLKPVCKAAKKLFVPSKGKIKVGEEEGHSTCTWHYRGGQLVMRVILTDGTPVGFCCLGGGGPRYPPGGGGGGYGITGPAPEYGGIDVGGGGGWWYGGGGGALA